MEKESVIEIRNLNKSFGSNHVLTNFEMDLLKGENLAVLGKSGSGKSVLIKCIIGLYFPEQGSIKLFDRDISEFDHYEWDRVRQRIGFLFQSNALYDSMTIRENLEFPLRRHELKHLTDKETENLIIDTLSNVGLEHTIDMMPSELSGGMRKRIALARALILKPEIILYDEPTTGLDPITSREISHLILEVQKKYNTSSIIISHDMSCINIASNRIIMLIEGRCYAQGDYDHLKNMEDEKVKEFFL
ncbi:MAG TPA: ABC transporter ATP-binding protein [Cytophagales bacterium]|jgi:phospholipid/cholesterol/gamma-HCH transport system ATP-binding protein|nr:ABC transporter ATP-binding protein [Cytophagales bacterium]